MNAHELSTKSLAELTAIYNMHTDKPIKKFGCSKMEAVCKVLAVMEGQDEVETEVVGIEDEAQTTETNDELVEDGSEVFVPATALEKSVKTKKMGIGKRIVELLKAGISPKDGLSMIQAEFVGCKTTMACIYW